MSESFNVSNYLRAIPLDCHDFCIHTYLSFSLCICEPASVIVNAMVQLVHLSHHYYLQGTYQGKEKYALFLLISFIGA